MTQPHKDMTTAQLGHFTDQRGIKWLTLNH
jgi:hypothetical protein